MTEKNINVFCTLMVPITKKGYPGVVWPAQAPRDIIGLIDSSGELGSFQVV